METKTCTKCKVAKVKKEFSVSDLSNSLPFIVCKECKRQKRKETNYTQPTNGLLYVIVNKAWPGWCKVGLTTKTDVEQRLLSYQIGSPFRDYECVFSVHVSDVYNKEYKVHKLLEEVGTRNMEWFLVDVDLAVETIKYVKENFS